MALSSQWGQSVVVRADTKGEVVVPTAPNSQAAKAYAAAGNPIVIRPRDAEHFQDLDPNSRGGGPLVAQEQGGGGGALTKVLVTSILGRDISETFWIPDPSKNEMGLLEMLYRRGTSNKNNILLQSRPIQELQFNYSTVNGNNIDLSHNCFRLSKTALAVHQMDQALGNVEEEYDSYYAPQQQQQQSSPRSARFNSPTVSISTKDFKQSIRASLQAVQEEDYYLVKYRDYSAWAVSHYRWLAKSDKMFGKKYVEQALAVHVGREPGELVLLTEEQFLLGVDILQRQLMTQLNNVRGHNNSSTQNYSQYQIDTDYCALNADQFRSLGAVLGDGMRAVQVQGEEEKRRKEEEERLRQKYSRSGNGWDDYEAPAWWDWSPAAVRARVQHQLSYYYSSLGKLIVQTAVIGAVGYVAYSYVRGYLPSNSGEDGPYNGGRNNNNNRRRGGGRNYRSNNNSRYDDDYDYRPTLFRSIMMGPKEVFDYMLAPRGEGNY